ncbi:DUF192 domain-containing protein [Candidatus Peregrinibacteria bacterium]|nr:DUF192 domain-containing protein [Candidatus Peregrinibacteria bacterium]
MKQITRTWIMALLLILIVLLLIQRIRMLDDRKILTVYSGENEVKILVELAQTEEERAMGLMGRENLKAGRGMLFYYPVASRMSMWMKNMLIPLDIVFINAHHQIIQIEENVPPCKAADDTDCPRYTAKEPAIFVLEVPANFSNQQGINIGDSVFLSPSFK